MYFQRGDEFVSRLVAKSVVDIKKNYFHLDAQRNILEAVR